MSIDASDSLIGSIALQFVASKIRPQLESDPDFRGAFTVLSEFTPAQLVGFVSALENEGDIGFPIKIQFPLAALHTFGVSTAHLTSASAVQVRNENRGNGLVVIAAALESDELASLADSDSTGASDLKDRGIASIWVDFVAKSVGINLLPEDRRKAEAMLKGLFDTGRCPTSKAGEFLTDVLTHFHRGEVLNRAAGKALPIIGLPLFEDCFSSLNEVKMGQPSQWAAKFKSHYSLECYLDKRSLKQDLLDPDKLRSRLAELQSPDHQPPIPEPVLTAFHDYIESSGTRNSATETLLFKFDWNYTTHCFERPKKTSAKDFSQRTRGALEAEAITPTSDDELVLQALTKIARKPGSASDEFREFFERRTDALEKDTPLYLEWEDFVHGKKIECVDLFQGIFACVQRAIRGLSSFEAAYVVLEGRQQKKPNSFMDMNQRACEFFERAYGCLEVRTKRKIQFTETRVCNYSQDVLPKIKDKPKFKGTSKSVRATTLEFLVSVFQKQRGGTDRKVITLSLSWKFPIGSVLGQEAADFDAICRYQAQRGTALVECVAEYEVVGRKGLPVSLSLESVEGFADVARGGGRGAFIPAQDRIKSLAAQWKETLEGAASRQWLLPAQISDLSSDFHAFESAYAESVLALRKSALAGERVPEAAAAYRALLLKINGLKHQDARRQLLRIVLRVGLAQVQRSGRRPPMAVICPWHPLRMEAATGRQQQVLGLIEQLLGKDRPPFSDGTTGSLFFREVEQLLSHPLYPEMTVVWESTQAFPRVVTQAFAGYTLHQPPESSSESSIPSLDDESSTAAATIEREMMEYLRLQPHERDNFSVLLYNCDSPDLPTAVVDSINRINAKREDDKITCQVLLMHRDEDHLRHIYRDLVARGVDTEADPTEASGDFLAKVRVNITAANRLRREGRSQPVDIAYCRDLISREAKPVWEWLSRETVPTQVLQPHQWSRRLPVGEGDRRVRLQLACPAQTETGWAYLYSLAVLCASGADDAWAVGKCPVLMRCIDFDDQSVERIFRETHELATWVVNQDELLDRKLLEAQHVKVIRYVQSATQGRNLIISSDARETLLVNTLKEKLKALLASDTRSDVIDILCKRFMEDANKISGGLVLKAARRANNTNELLGIVLSRYLVQSELGAGRPIAWCFLDDYSQWLGKREDAKIADLLVLAPKTNEDGLMHLDVVVTEAKFVTYDALGGAASTSAKQLMDTLSQLTEAMDGEARTIDQDIWLARLSDLLVSQTGVALGEPPLDSVAWRRAIRQRQCTFRIWGYSHVFVNEPHDLTAQVSTVKGIPAGKGRAGLDSLQETFGPGHVRELVVHYHEENHKATAELRLRNGHPAFGKSKLYHLASKAEPKAASNNREPENRPGDTLCGVGTRPDPQTPPPIITQSAGTGGNFTGLGPAAVSDSRASQSSTPGSLSSSLIAFLAARAGTFQNSEAEGQAWLETVTAKLRQALITRGLPAKFFDGFTPTLTPNSGIIKLQGSKDLTVQAVESRADEIFTSEGVKIISATPEPGRVSIAVARPKREVLHTTAALHKFLSTDLQAGAEERVFVGVKEEDGTPICIDPFQQPHTLVAGATNSGKSVLIQNIILGIVTTRTPDESKIALIDPKLGGDYADLAKLPHFIKDYGNVITDPPSAIKCIEDMVGIMESRYRMFAEAGFGINNIKSYRKKTGKNMPTIWLIHDEFPDWMQIEEYRDAVTSSVNRLSVKARAAGIYLIFAAQRPDNTVFPMQFRNQLGNKLVLRVAESGTSVIALGQEGAERLLGHGHMLAKVGLSPDPVFAQVPFIDTSEGIPEIVEFMLEVNPTP
jgi:S-DNA-T family DNA segregation ATPase FtsK/SpoIIIE